MFYENMGKTIFEKHLSCSRRPLVNEIPRELDTPGDPKFSFLHEAQTLNQMDYNSHQCLMTKTALRTLSFTRSKVFPIVRFKVCGPHSHIGIHTQKGLSFEICSNILLL